MRSLFIGLLCMATLPGLAQNYYLFIGTYTAGNKDSARSKGIYVYQFNAESGRLKPVSTADAQNPSYLAITPGGHFVYAVTETDGDTAGGVSAYSFDPAKGRLSFLNKQASGGEGPCYVSVDAHRKWAFVANYSGGSLSALPILSDGSLAPLAELIQHTGKGPNPERQEKPHVHSVIFSPDEHFLLTADLGLDNLTVYNFNTAAALPLAALPNDDSLVTVAPGSGPRHTAFYPGKPYVYLINELSGRVDAFTYSGGKFTAFQHISSYPAGYKGAIGSADIHIAPGGKFLYVSNRGDANNIAIYAIDKTNGKLTLKGFQTVLGITPRNFIIDPTDHWLLVANQRSNNIVEFKINQATGLLKPTGIQLRIPSPVCLKMSVAPAK